MSDYPLDPESVSLVLQGLIRQATNGMCRAGRICDLCDCFAGPEGFANEQAIAEGVLREGVARIMGGQR